jgi:hypothetical protein
MHVDTFKLNSNGVFVPFVRDENSQLVQVAVAPMDGAQEAFLCAPEREVGLAGNRGGGKTHPVDRLFCPASVAVGAPSTRAS